MKQLFIIQLIIVNAIAAYSQSDLQNDFKGTWISGANKNTMKLNFVDGTKIFVDLGADGNMQGQYKFHTFNNNIILSIRSLDKTRTDSLIFTLTKLNKEEYKIIMIEHLYNDRPPEHLLDERNTYLLKKVKTD